MNDDFLRNLLRRLLRLEEQSVRYRQGEITDLSPLSVALGGSDVPYTSVKALDGPQQLAVGDVVACLVFGNDLLVLGRVGAGLAIVRGIVNANGTIAEGTGFTVSHPGTGDYTVTFDEPFADIPAFNAWAASVGGPVMTGVGGSPVDASSARTIALTLAGAPINTEFHFIAVGPRA